MWRSVAVEVCGDSRATTPRNDSKFNNVKPPRLETSELSTCRLAFVLYGSSGTWAWSTTVRSWHLGKTTCPLVNSSSAPTHLRVIIDSWVDLECCPCLALGWASFWSEPQPGKCQVSSEYSREGAEVTLGYIHDCRSSTGHDNHDNIIYKMLLFWPFQYISMS